MIGVGIVGFGKMGEIRAEVVERTGRGEVVAVYDPGETAKTAYRRAPSPSEVIEDGSVQAVFVCTPNHLNRPLTIAALGAGKHVFCEKPPAFTAAEVQDIMAVEKDSGAKLMYGFNHRHHTSIKHIKALIDGGEYGEVLWMRGRYGKSVDQSFYQHWRADPALSGGGILIDQGIHMLDLFLHLGGSFDEVEAFDRRSIPSPGRPGHQAW